jgi:hypothetical protein
MVRPRSENGGAVAPHSFDRSASEEKHVEDVRILATRDGGWDVTALLDDRVVATRHCTDWHRAERARRQLEFMLHVRLPEIAAGAVLLLVLTFVGAGSALAQIRETGSNDPDSCRLPRASPEVRGLFSEPRGIGRGIEFANRLITSGNGGEVKNGFYPELSNMVTGAGWISVGPGYRHWFSGDRVFVDGSAAISWRSYKMAQTRFELTNLARSRVAVGSQVRWQDLTQVTYFGPGSASVEADRSEYRLQSTNVVGYTTIRPERRLAIEGRVGWLSRPSLSSPAGAFRRGNPATAHVFPDNPAFALPQQPSFGYRELSVAIDTRSARSYPTRGGMYRAAWAGYSDQDYGPFSFRRSEAEAAQFVPLAGSRIVLAMHGWLVASHTSAGRTVPFYFLPSLGGNNTVRSYSDFRFHDRHLLVVNAETRVALFAHVDAALFVDAGNVAPRVGDLNLDKTALGVGLRMHTRQSTFARFDIAHGSEGWRFLFRTSDPLHLSRLSRRTANVPFAP